MFEGWILTETNKQIIVVLLNYLILGIFLVELWRIHKKGWEMNDFIEQRPDKAFIYASVLVLWVTLFITQTPAHQILWATAQNVTLPYNQSFFNVSNWSVTP